MTAPRNDSHSTVTVFLHAETDKAVLVHTGPLSHEADHIGVWLPKSRITVLGREVVKNPLFGTQPQIGEILGTHVTVEAPDWMLNKLRKPAQ